ncbi:PREDICTED: 39S ribosomal protein L32, mitochondrial-like [Rhagoletis zephyria]|uniref:39S ribosomal protein L32, mitochondrial-like n=1 Tax=Rhagoletis zephyria TaxID=28612 RepID=UPI00081132B8|nr:PREDICTED: 39S ribosomal protein L32, mitochondrial-like [Rhagoletis zephyria]
MQQLILSLRQTFSTWKYIIQRFNQPEPLWALNSALLPSTQEPKSFSINELMREGMLWGVPKKRPTIESRLRKRFGVPNYPQNTRLLKPRSDLVVCERCGDHHEVHTICRTCYIEVKTETEKIKGEIKEQTDPLEPKEKEVFLRFENENANEPVDKFRIIEISRPRPKWFTKNLLARSTGKVAPTRDVIINPEDTIGKH